VQANKKNSSLVRTLREKNHFGKRQLAFSNGQGAHYRSSVVYEEAAKGANLDGA
jgi:hypothetical protein